ncbi:MAG TPA: RNA polymerase sigma factor [Burkholderiales bacterium]|jgi:RNA polymerase sigma-70 factor (ECF subfamily)|nr:RNA polymerase sigma factor [Burkholderiales bacterium]
MEAPDEALMLAYGGGDAGAFEILYARHRGALFRFVLRGVKQRALAEELYQEIWMRVIEARHGYSPTARFTTWLYTIAHHRLVDHWRRRELAVAADSDVAELSAGAASDPARQAEARESLARFARALEALPHAQREAFLLHEEAGLTAMEIAAVTGSETEAVKSRLRYAVAKLKAAIDHG